GLVGPSRTEGVGDAQAVAAAEEDTILAALRAERGARPGHYRSRSRRIGEVASVEGVLVNQYGSRGRDGRGGSEAQSRYCPAENETCDPQSHVPAPYTQSIIPGDVYRFR